MLFKKEYKCLFQKLFIIVALLFVISSIFLNTTDTFATNNFSYDYGSFEISYNTPFDSNCYLSNFLSYNQIITTIHNTCNLYAGIVASGNNSLFSVSSDVNYMTISGKFNYVTFTDSNIVNYLPEQNSDYPPSIDTVTFNGTSQSGVTIENSQVFINTTDWVGTPPGTQLSNTKLRTFTVEYSLVLRGTFPSTVNRMFVYFDTYIWTGYSLGYNAYFERDINNRIYIDLSTNATDALLNQQNQLLILMNEGSNEYYDKTYEAIDNIEGQNASDIPNSSSSQTTSIIGTISSFVSALGTVQAGSCELTLPFPEFVGGNTVVNPCRFKEKAPAIISIGSSMLLIGVFIPLAFILLKMIYNEIRSFTNG